MDNTSIVTCHSHAILYSLFYLTADHANHKEEEYANELPWNIPRSKIKKEKKRNYHILHVFIFSRRDFFKLPI